MCIQQLPQEEFFIYVPLLHTKESLTAASDSRDENVLNRSAYEDWIKISLAERFVVYAHVCGEEEQMPLLHLS